MNCLTAAKNFLMGRSETKGYCMAWSFAYRDGQWFIAADYQISISKNSGGTKAVRVFVDNEGQLRFSMDDVIHWTVSIHYKSDKGEWLDMLMSYFRYNPYIEYIPITPYSDKLDMSRFASDLKQLPG